MTAEAATRGASEADLLHEADVAAERLGCAVRMGVALVLLIALKYLVHHRPGELPDVDEQIFYATIMLDVLLGTGLVVFLLLRSGWWRRWMAYATVTVDAAVIAVSLHLDFKVSGLPGDVAFAFPLMTAIPLILVVHMLRLRPGVQAYATILVLGSVAFIAAHAGHVDLSERTRIAGELTPLFGFPPNVMRFLMLLLAGATLVLAAARGRRLLHRAVEETTRRLNLGRYLPAELASVMAAGRMDELKTGRRATVALLFVDIRDSTTMEENLDPAKLAALMSEFRSRVSRAAAAHRGVVDKFIGDGAFLVFGVPEAAADDAARAIGCGKAIIASLASWNDMRRRAGEEPIRVGIGIHAGEAFVGAVGDDARLEFTVLGDAVNVACRLEQATKEHAVPLIVSRDALVVAGEDPAAWDCLGSQRLRGRPLPVEIYAPASSPELVTSSVATA
ncbi:adenylate/guanylate cyclase domain-containing protein [Chelatococcus albus]|nr:adenylate/guanylate cyclase domain-containing protein [Chelatococcus sp. SYSU_G07232]